MSSKSKFPKVALDMFFVQGIWTLYFLGIITVIQVANDVVVITRGGGNSGFLLSAQISSRIFMLVIGIIAAVYFPRFFVENGVSRKDSFRGIALGTLGLAIALTFVSHLIGTFESLLISGFNLPITLENVSALDAEDLADIQSNILANLFIAILVPTAAETISPWGISFVIAILSKYLLYCAGFLIGTTFHRFNFLVGIGVIFVNAFLVLAYGALLGLPVNGFFFGTELISLSLPIVFSLLGSLLIIGLMLWAARQISKKAPIKL